MTVTPALVETDEEKAVRLALKMHKLGFVEADNPYAGLLPKLSTIWFQTFSRQQMLVTMFAKDSPKIVKLFAASK